MNIKIVFYFLGWVLNVEALLMLIPCLTAIIYKESCLLEFLIVMGICVALGRIATHKKPQNTVFYAREGFALVSLSWLTMSFFGALPFWISGEIPSLTNALFEVVSGFTTTGASILTDIETLSRSMLMWRSFTHWIGGMGVLVFLLAVLPLVGGGYNMHIMRAESPGPAVGKLVPRVKTTAKILYIIYFSLTMAQVILLLIGKMPLFDALTVGFGTAGTGGFAIKNISIAYYDNYYIQGVITLFMILFGINFNMYYLFLIGKAKDAFRSEEVRTYLLIISASIVLITLNIRSYFPTLFDAFHHAAFQVSSIITTTGFSTVNFDLWPQFSKTLLVLLMFVGACAGSTGGGMKISRLIIWVRVTLKELLSLVHPRSIKVMRLEGKVIENSVVRTATAYFIAYIMVFMVSLLLISLDNLDFTTGFTAVAATLNNIGPGLGGVGPACNFYDLSTLSKYVLMFDMLAGRLEIFPMLLLFSPTIWKNQ